MLILHRIGRFGDAIPYMNNVIRTGKAFASPPSEPYRRVSRIRLSSQETFTPLAWRTFRRTGRTPCAGTGCNPCLQKPGMHPARRHLFQRQDCCQYLRKVLHACYMRHSAAAMATFITFSSPALSNSFVIFPVPALFTTPVTQPPLRPMEAARVRTVDDSIS